MGGQFAPESVDTITFHPRQRWRKVQGPVSRKSRELFGPEKPFLKLPPAYSVKLVFSYVVKGMKIKITAKFRASRRLCFEDTKRNMSPEKFRDFRETGPRTLFHEFGGDGLRNVFLHLTADQSGLQKFKI